MRDLSDGPFIAYCLSVCHLAALHVRISNVALAKAKPPSSSREIHWIHCMTSRSGAEDDELE